MSTIIEIGFGNDKSRSRKNNTTKIYNRGSIVISRPQSSKNPYAILSIKSYNSLEKTKNKSFTKNKSKKLSLNKKKKYKKTEYKSIKKSVEEMHKKIKKEIDKMNEDEELKKNVGYILRNTFTKEELENIVDFGPSPKQNKLKLLKKKVDDEQNTIKKIKPYIPQLDKNENKNINERYLKSTINIYKDNEFIVNKINDMLKNSKYINEEEIKKEKERKKMKIDNEKKQIRAFIQNKRKEIKSKVDNDNINININDDNNNDNFNFHFEEFNADEAKNNQKEKNEKEKEEKAKNDIKEDKKIKKVGEGSRSKKNKSKSSIIGKDNKFIKIVDITKDQKYIDADIRLKRTKENCDKAKEFVLEIENKIREDKKKFKNPEYNTTHKQKANIEIKAKQIIEEVKSNIDKDNFSVNKLNKEDQKLMKGGKRYNPNNKKKNKKIKNSNVDKNNEPILISSINSVKNLKEINNDFRNAFKINNFMDEKEKNVGQKWKNDMECAKAYLNNFNKAQKIDLNKIKKEKKIELENKNDIYNYIYMPKEYDAHWYNNKDTNDKTEYRHPFLIYDD
jgi:hypothetical protein